jgi:hypothetical protein
VKSKKENTVKAEQGLRRSKQKTNKVISVFVLNDLLNQTIRVHNKSEVRARVPKDFARGFLEGIRFVKKHIVNTKAIQI